MKFSKASIVISVLTFLVFGVSIANLVYCMNINDSVPMAIGIAVVMAGIFVACLITAFKDAKKAALNPSDDDDYEDDDE